MLQPFYQSAFVEAGVDEAGRGCFAGPVFAAAVVLPSNFRHPQLNDSKKLSEKQRDILRPIIETNAIAFCVAQISNEEIDEINILQASFKAMHHAIAGLGMVPEFLIIDGNRFVPYKNIPHQTIIRGDGLYGSIAAAGILAKTHRDELMDKLDREFPQYGWAQNKGYGTLQHRQAIEKHGICKYHRKSYKLLSN